MKNYNGIIIISVFCFILLFFGCPPPSNTTTAIAAGDAQWAKSVTTGLHFSEFSSVAVDAGGNTYAAGFINGNQSYDFGNSKTVSGPNFVDSVVLVKYK
ncbi:MAG: hypothetical protein JW969_05145 [Spirochaetales bacterium]|nr:hypothetical protein [Spirochaetales bacterium]